MPAARIAWTRLDVEARAVYTNNPPSGAMRGFGVNQTAFAIEGMLDRLAERVGIDGWEIRWRNALETGDRFATGQRLGPGVGLRKTLLAVRDAYRAAPIAGIACGVKNSGIGNGLTEYGRAILRPEADGTITLYHSWTEMGQGCHTVFAQLAATELGVPLDRIVVLVDTERELDTGETTASRATMLGGRAVLRGRRRASRRAGRPTAARPSPAASSRARSPSTGRRRSTRTSPSRDPLRLRLGDPGRHPRRARAGSSGSSPRTTWVGR